MTRRARAFGGTALASLLVLSACGGHVIAVGVVEPEPTPTAELLAPLVLRVQTAEPLRAPRSGKFPAVELRGVRESLAHGFDRAFPGADGLVSGPRGARVLVIHIRSLAFVSSSAAERHGDGPQIVLVHGGLETPRPVTPATTRYARIQFTATLLEGAREMGRLSSVALSPGRSRGDRASVSRAVAAAMSAMYEQIGKALFERQTARQLTSRQLDLRRAAGGLY